LSGAVAVLLFMFQSTPPRGGRRSKWGLYTEYWMFQSTPPRGGRLVVVVVQSVLLAVSIHAPAWGATRIVSKACLES
jgi:hypothetical protein